MCALMPTNCRPRLAVNQRNLCLFPLDILGSGLFVNMILFILFGGKLGLSENISQVTAMCAFISTNYPGEQALDFS